MRKLKYIVVCLLSLLMYNFAESQPNLSSVEYYIDNDPGYGNATPINGISGTNISNRTINIDPATLSTGLHLFGIRAKDVNGSWSLDNTWLFLKPDTTKTAIPDIMQIEYYLDKDPGYGKAIPIAIDHAKDYPDFNLFVNISTLKAGKHKIYLRSKDSKGGWSMNNVDSFTVSTAVTGASIVVTSVASKTVCSNAMVDVSYQKQGSFAVGNQFKVQLSDSAGNFGSPIEIGSIADTVSRIITCKLPAHLKNGSFYKIRVVSTSPALTSVNTKDSITILGNPYAQTISGPPNANVATNYTYSVPFVTGSSWNWIAPAATITPNANKATLFWNITGSQQLQVIEKDINGCIGDTSSKLINVYKPSIDSVKVDDLTLCPGQSINVTAKVSGLFSSGNIFTVQLSNVNGGFSSPKNIGSITLAPSGSNQPVTIPVTFGSIVNGTKYRIRVISSLPKDTSSDNGKNITFQKPDLGKDTVTLVCPGGTANLTSLYTITGYTTVIWSTPNPEAAPKGSYTLTVINSGGCSDTAGITVNERIAPLPAINPAGNIKICPADSLALTAAAGYNSYLWNTGQITPAIYAKASGNYNVTVTDSYDCMGTSLSTVISFDTCGKPKSLAVSSVAGTSSGLSWGVINCADHYNVRYKKSDASTWITVNSNTNSFMLTGLSVSTTYNWQVRSVCKDGSLSNYTAGPVFTTLSQLSTGLNKSFLTIHNPGLTAFINPNPAGSSATLNISQAKGKVEIMMFDITGKKIWENDNPALTSKIYLPIQNLAQGTYLVIIKDEKERLVLKMVKTK